MNLTNFPQKKNSDRNLDNYGFNCDNAFMLIFTVQDEWFVLTNIELTVFDYENTFAIREYENEDLETLSESH